MLEVCGSSKTNYIERIFHRLQSVRRPDTTPTSCVVFLSPSRRTMERTASTEHSPSWEANTSTFSKFPTFYGTPMFITIFTTAVLSTYTRQARSVLSRYQQWLQIQTTFKTVATETQKIRYLLVLFLWYVAVNNRKNDKCFHGNETMTRLFCLPHLHCSVLMHTKDAISIGPNWRTNTRGSVRSSGA